MTGDSEPAEVRLIKRAPAAAARVMFETVKAAVDECDPDERYELVHEIYEWALTGAGSHGGDAHAAYLVCLDSAIRDDVATRTLDLLMAIRHVISVEVVTSEDVGGEIARKQAQHRYHRLLTEALTNG